MTDVEIGRGKTGRRAYSLAEIGIVPARRTRDPEEVSIAWQIDAYRFDLPLMACPMDSVVSPATAIQIGRLGGLAVLDLEGLWTRYEAPEPLLAEVTELDEQAATRRLQAMYAEPISEDLIGRRIVVITNLAPRKMRGLESHGMLLAASESEGSKPVLATLAEDVALGSRLK